MRLQVADQSAPFDPLTEGNTLRRAMRVEELAQDRVAVAVGISEAYLSRLIRGRRPLSPEMAARIRTAIDALSESVA